MTERDEKFHGLAENIKQTIIDYLLEHHNIEALDDETEKRIYNYLLSSLSPLIFSLLRGLDLV